MNRPRSKWENIFTFGMVIVCLVFGAVVDSAIEGGWATGQKGQDARLTYDQVDSGLDGISRLVELLSSDSFKQSSAEVQEAASMTIEAFVLQFGPSLDEAKETGDTNHLGLLRALMSGDKDAEIFYRRELGLIKVKPYSGD
jgi:hypothetical protein